MRDTISYLHHYVKLFTGHNTRVRITLFNGERQVFREVFAPALDWTPDSIVESELSGSVNGVIPGSVLQPGVRMVVELDPEGLVPLSSTAQIRYPSEGTAALRVVQPPLFRQIFVPTIATSPADQGVEEWAAGLGPDSPELRLARTLMPVGTLEVEAHDVYHTAVNLQSSSGWAKWLREIQLLYFSEGRRGYYYGVVKIAPNSTNFLGLANLALPVSVGVTEDWVYVHELGHNMRLEHAPCGTPDPDPRFPYQNGSSGVWGYDFFEDQLISPDEYKDIMSYCGPVWISDYHFEKATKHRLGGDGGIILDGQPLTSNAANAGEMLVVWGSVREGQLTLDPSFVVNGPAALPETNGPYRVEGLDVTGRKEFSLSFSPTPVEFGGGNFVFLVPYQDDWSDSLDRLVLTGPEPGFLTPIRSTGLRGMLSLCTA